MELIYLSQIKSDLNLNLIQNVYNKQGNIF